MEYRNLGASGLKISVLSFGTGTFGGYGPLFSAWGGSGVDEARRLEDMAVGQLWRANRTNRTRFAVTSVEGRVCQQASPGDSRFSGHGLVRQLQDGQDFVARQTERLFLYLEAIAPLEAEPRVRRHLPRKVLLGGIVEEHVRGEGRAVERIHGKPPGLDHRSSLEPASFCLVVAGDGASSAGTAGSSKIAKTNIEIICQKKATTCGHHFSLLSLREI
jgi:hypothetical protein